MNGIARIGVLAALAFGLCAPALAAPPSSDVAGQVSDEAGSPIVGASLKFTNSTDPKTTYEVKTDKKGRFSYTGLLYIPPGMWKVSVQAPGFVPLKLHVESKTSSAVVANADSPMKADGTPYEFPLKAFGNARLDIVMTTPDKVAAAPSAGGAAKPGATPAPPSDDPLAQAAARIHAGDLEGAVPFYQKAALAKPDDADLHLEYGKVLLQLDRHAEAEAEARRAAELAPNMKGPHRIVASVKAAKGNYAEAYAEMEKERALAPDDPSTIELTAKAADLAGKTAEAITLNESLVAAHPDNVQAWMSLGELYSRTGKTDKSQAAYHKVTELDPANAYRTFFKIGAVIVESPNPTQADMRKAVEAFRQSVQLKPDFAPANKQLAYTLLNVGQIDEVRGVIEAYLKIDGASADAAEMKELLNGLPPPKKK